MQRYKLTLEYDGSPFVGWQRQINGCSVQQILENAIECYCGHKATAHAAGRTDAGVHACGQVAHIDIARHDSPSTVRDALNAHMRPYPIAVLHAEAVDSFFHARFSARERAYIYRITSRRAPLVLDARRAWWIVQPLDAAAMHNAGQLLVGEHDFSSFRATACQAQSPIKTLDELRVTTQHTPDGLNTEIFVRARSFLHHQVRNIAGTLMLIGRGKWNANDLRTALNARDRQQGGPTAPACGLYFMYAHYEDSLEIKNNYK